MEMHIAKRCFGFVSLILMLVLAIGASAMGGPLDDWYKRKSGATRPLAGAAYGNGIYMVVGESGTILTSSDGGTWTRRTSGITKGLWAIAFGGDTFVAVGQSGTILTSPDGVTWTPRISGTTNDLNGVIYADSTFVAVGETPGVGAATILTSPDGMVWTSRVSGVMIPLNGVAYGNSTFVAVGDLGTIRTSPDGETWGSVAPPTSSHLDGVTFENGIFVAVGQSGTIVTSDNGTSWTLQDSQTDDRLHGIAYGTNIFVAVGEAGTILTSPNGIAWTGKTSGVTVVLAGVAGGPDSIVVSGDKGTILQSYTVPRYALTLSRQGLGKGQITSRPSGINCGKSCSADFSEGAVVTLTATASKGSVFTSWSDCGSLSGADCVVTMSEPITVTANFSRLFKLTVSRTSKSKGDGTISSSDGHISCGADCSELYAENTPVILSASSAPDSVFTAWSLPACPVTGDCTVTVDKAKTVKATFVGPQTLTVRKASVKKGTGNVKSTPDGIDCGDTCKFNFTYNSSVTLSAKADGGSVFSGWSLPACPGTGDCTVTMDKAKSVTAKFTKDN